MPPPALTLQVFSATRTQYLVSVLNSPFDVRERTESCLPSAKHAIRQCTEDDDNDVIGNLNANAEALSGASPPVDYMFMMAFAGPLNMCEAGALPLLHGEKPLGTRGAYAAHQPPSL